MNIEPERIKEPLLTTGYSVTICGPSPPTDPWENLYFGSLAINDRLDAKQWNNSHLSKITYCRYMALTDEQIVKYGLVWLYELLSGDILGAVWFSEWTLLLALQLKHPFDGEASIRLFGDFLIDANKMELSLIQIYEIRYRNLMAGANVLCVDSVVNRINLLARKNISTFACEHFFNLLQTRTSNDNCRFITFMAWSMLRVCSNQVFSRLRNRFENTLPDDFFAGLLRDIPMPHIYSLMALRRTFCNGSMQLRSILIPTLAIYSHIEKVRGNNSQNVEDIKSLLNHSILSVFRFNGLHAIESYLAACENFHCTDGSLLTLLAFVDQQFSHEYEALNVFIRIYAKGDPERSLYPWSRCLDVEYLAQYDCEEMPWICSVMGAICCLAESNILSRLTECLFYENDTSHLRSMATEVASQIHKLLMSPNL